MLRAAIVTPNLTLGGAERWVVSLVKSADPSRLRWTGVVVNGWGGAERSLCQEINELVPLYCNFVQQSQRIHSRPFDYSSFAEIHSSLPEAVAHACDDADVLLAWGGPDISTWLPPLTIPVVLTSHTTEQSNGAGPVQGATHLAAVSHAAARFFRGRGVDHLPITVIYNGAEVERCRPRVGRERQRDAWGVADTDVVVGYIGRQSREKNPRAAIDSIAQLPPQFKAVYCGEPSIRPQDVDLNLREYAAERAPGRVIFMASVPAVGDVLAGLDVVMLASHREAFSLTLIEAWIAGVPVVATPVGSVPELQREYGSLVNEVPVNPTPAELGEAVCRATSADGRDIASHAQQLALCEFTCEKMVERWTNYFEHLSKPN